MAAHVLPDARLVKLAGRFVWLSIDSEKDRNAGFLEAFPTTGFPTYLVVDPESGKAVLRWYGSATVKQFGRLLDDALVAMRAAGGSGPEAALAAADRANAEGRVDEAAAGYREALARGGASWDRRARALASLEVALSQAGRLEECAAAAQAELPGLARGPAVAPAAAAGLSCALDAEESATWRAAALAKLEPLVRRAARIEGLLADDRADILRALSDARAAAGDEKGSRAYARRLWSFLEAEARRTPDAELRASLDSFRVQAALALGRPRLAVPALEASEKAIPDDYNPPYRLAILYREMGRYDLALAAADRALGKAYGPRKLRTYDLKASSQQRKGDRAGEQATLEEAVAFAGSLPAPQRQIARRLADAMQARLAKLRE